ncbi:MAG TPA: aspartate aminotransferase family protein, partial [Spirochaetota bacterium]|nr:aspartate aminotransferase family protein [Spirochaetota bacterium]
TGAHLTAGAAGDRLSKGLSEMFERLKLPFVAFNHGSICHMETGAAMLMDIKNPNIFKEVGARKKVMEEMGAAMTAEGIITLAGSRLYTSMADTDEVVDDALNRFENIFKHIEVKKD